MPAKMNETFDQMQYNNYLNMRYMHMYGIMIEMRYNC